MRFLKRSPFEVEARLPNDSVKVVPTLRAHVTNQYSLVPVCPKETVTFPSIWRYTIVSVYISGIANC